MNDQIGKEKTNPYHKYRKSRASKYFVKKNGIRRKSQWKNLRKNSSRKQNLKKSQTNKTKTYKNMKESENSFNSIRKNSMISNLDLKKANISLKKKSQVSNREKNIYSQSGSLLSRDLQAKRENSNSRKVKKINKSSCEERPKNNKKYAFGGKYNIPSNTKFKNKYLKNRKSINQRS